jgi:hypothetical protein
MHEADGGVVNVHFDWRPKNNVSNYAPMSLIGTLETCRRDPKTSAYRGRPEVIDAPSE